MMKNIKLMNKIAKVGTEVFEADNFAVSDKITNPDAIMVRSASLHDMEFPDSLVAIARAGAGVNNIPVDREYGQRSCSSISQFHSSMNCDKLSIRFS